MEYIFKQLVDYSDSYEILLYNLPIREAQRTLGEIDFILKDKNRDQLVHVELTYKFYLIDPAILEPEQQLIGPNKRDLFFAKMEKIKNRQFPLLHSNAAATALAEHQIDHLKLEHQCCFKAQLFFPFGDAAVDIGVLNKDCLAGYWLRFADFNKTEFAKAQYYMPTKSEWVIEPHDQVTWKSHVEMLIDIELKLLDERAPMIWLKRNKKIEKIFIVWW